MKSLLLTIVSLATYISYIPQILRLYKTKKSEDISLSSWFLWVISALAYFTYAILEKNIGLMITIGSNLLLTSIVFIMTIYYKKWIYKEIIKMANQFKITSNFNKDLKYLISIDDPGKLGHVVLIIKEIINYELIEETDNEIIISVKLNINFKCGDIFWDAPMIIVINYNKTQETEIISGIKLSEAVFEIKKRYDQLQLDCRLPDKDNFNVKVQMIEIF